MGRQAGHTSAVPTWAQKERGGGGEAVGAAPFLGQVVGCSEAVATGDLSQVAAESRQRSEGGVLGGRVVALGAGQDPRITGALGSWAPVKGALPGEGQEEGRGSGALGKVGGPREGVRRVLGWRGAGGLRVQPEARGEAGSWWLVPAPGSFKGRLQRPRALPHQGLRAEA